jgi:beta-glucanase (GH16 family)
MHSKSPTRLLRLITAVIPIIVLTGCGQGSGPERIPGTPKPPVVVPPANCADAIDFEDACGPFVFSDFGGGVASVIDNPDASGINTTSKVGQMQKFAGEVYGGSTLALSDPVDFSAGEAFKMKVWSSRAVDVLFKFEGLNQERSLQQSGSGSWEELCFDFTGSTAGPAATAITLIFDLGVNGDAGNDPANWTFYFDGIEQVASCAGGGISYELVFADEFDTGTAPSTANWNIDTGYGPNNNGWGNNEWQQYTSNPENVRVEGGNLVISALCPTAPCGVRDGTVTSARINSLGKFNFKFGKVEARIKPPVGKAAWPAFWSLGTNFPSVGWPQSGEIDFMEMHNFYSDDRTTHFTMHWCDQSVQAPAACTYPDGWVYDSQYLTTASSLGDDFHVFSAEWDENRIVGKIDGVQYFSKAIDPATMEEFLKEFFLIFDVAMGGTLGSGDQPPDGTEVFPQTMLVDYVRVYQVAGGPGAGDTTIDFEDAPASYDFGVDGGFGGGAAEVIANPQMNGIDTSAQVGRMLKFAGEVYGGSTLALPVPLTVTTGGTFTMKVWSPRTVNVLLKVEGPVQSEVEVTHSGTGWEELSFDFSGFTGSVEGLTLIFDLGTVGDAMGDPANWTFYFDDITVPTGTGGGGTGTGVIPDVVLYATDPNETIDLVFGVDYTSIEPFGSGSVFDNNNTSDADYSPAFSVTTGSGYGANIGQLAFLGFNAGFASGYATLDFKAKGLSNNLIRVKLLDSGDYLDVNLTAGGVSTSLGNGWYQVQIPITSLAGAATATGLLFETDNASPTQFTFLLTDIGFSGAAGGGGGSFAPITFDDAAVTYTLTGFGGAEGSTVTNDPAGGTNMVAQVVKTATAELWAGTTVSTGANQSIPTLPLDASNTTMTVRVYSPDAGIPVRLKIEDAADPTKSVETEALTTMANTWETLTFDFANPAAGTAAFNAAYTYNKVSIFFNFGTTGAVAGEKTYYFDDIDVGTAGGSGGGGSFAPITFDDAAVTYTLTGFGGAEGSTVTNDPAGGTNMVAQVVKTATAELWAGTTVSTEANQSIPTLPLDASNTTMTVRVYSPDAGIPVRLKIEDAADPTKSVETEALTTMANTWETLTFDFANEAAGTAAFNAAYTYNKVSIFFNFGTTGAVAGEKTYYFDDIAFGSP